MSIHYLVYAILVRPMATRCDATMIDTFKNIYEYLKVRNLAPNLHILDNECSKAVQKYVKAERVAYFQVFINVLESVYHG